MLRLAPRNLLRGGGLAVTADGAPLTVWHRNGPYSVGGTFRLDGRVYDTTLSIVAGTHLLSTGGASLASITGITHRVWTLQAGPDEWRFRRPSRWSARSVLVAANGQTAGTITRTGLGRAHEADLPGVPITLVVFALLASRFTSVAADAATTAPV